MTAVIARLKHLARHPRARVVAVVALLAVTVVAATTQAQIGSGGSNPVAATTTAVNLQKGLVGWWKMDGNTKDASPYGNNGTASGATLTADRKGVSSSAYNFSSASNEITAPNNSSLNFGVNDYSLSIWFKAASTTTGQELITKSVGGPGYGLYIDASASLKTYVGSHVAYNGPVAAGTWNYATVVRSGNTLYLYLNGVLFSSVGLNAGDNATSTEPLHIGKNSPNTAIDDVRIYNRALLASELKSMYDQYNPTLKAASGSKGLVGWWKMDGNAKDSSPYGNNGTVSSASLAADRKGAANAAYSFNGTNSSIAIPYSATIHPVNRFAVSSWVNMRSWYTGQCKYDTIYSSAPDTTSASFRIGMRDSAFDACNGTPTGLHRANLYMKFDDGARLDLMGTTNLQLNTWYYITGIYDGSVMKIYVNGVLENSVISSRAFTVPANVPSYIGMMDSSGFNYWLNGTLDDVRLYNRELSAADLKGQYDSYNATIASGGSGQADTNVQSGAVARYAMDGNANDTSGNGNNATNNGATLTADRYGRGSSAYAFNGSSSYLYVPNSSTLNTPTGNSWSMSAWINPSSVTGSRVVIRKSAYGCAYGLGVESGQVRSLFSFNTAATDFIEPTGGTVASSQWQHVVATYDNGKVTHYVNGAVVYSATYSNKQLTFCTDEINIGKVVGGAGGYFAGSIDEAQIYNRALSAAEVAKIANPQTISLGKGLVGQWAMDGNAKDGTPWGNNGTVTGATLAPDRKNRSSSAYSFTNNTDGITIPATSRLESQTFTLSAWIKPGAISSGVTVIGSGVNFGPQLQLTSDYRIALNKQNQVAMAMSGVVASLNVWSHVVATYDASTGLAVLYCNGVVVGTTVNAQTFVFSNYQIGKRGDTNETFKGSIDDARIYNRALNAGEVKALYEGYN